MRPRQFMLTKDTKGLSHLLRLGVLLLCALAGPLRADPTYSFGVVPQFEAMRLASIWMPILDELEQRTGYRFEMAGSSDIPTFERSFRSGDFDFAYMNPYHAVVAMEEQGYAPIVRDGGRALFGVLVVAKDSPYHSPGDLAGQTIAFPAPNALGASLLMRADLTRRFGLEFAPLYAGTHSSAYLNVVLGRAAAAGGVMATLDSQPADVRAQLRILYETERVPPHPVVVHPRVPDAVREAVSRAFLDMGQTDEGRALLAEVPFRQIATANAVEYHPLRDMQLERFVQ